MRKYLFIGISVILLFLSGYVYFQYYFVFGEGVKSGYLNYAVYKGNVFKTYEGKLIQEGFARTKLGSGVQSNEFEFSIQDEKLQNILATLSIENFFLETDDADICIQKIYQKASEIKGISVEDLNLLLSQNFSKF